MAQNKAEKAIFTDVSSTGPRHSEPATVIPFPLSCDRNAHTENRPSRSATKVIGEYYVRWRTRRELARELSTAPDTVLQDAGFTRQSLRTEISKPFWQA